MTGSCGAADRRRFLFVSEPFDSGGDVDAFQPFMTGVQPLEICGNVSS